MQPRSPFARLDLRLALACAALLAACGDSAAFHTESHVPGGSMPAQALIGPNFALNPATGRPFVVEPNSAGLARSLKVLQVASGRLVDCYDRDPVTGTRTLRFVDLLIGANIDSDGVDFLLEQKAVTQRFELTVLHAYSSPEFANAFTALEAGLQTFSIKSFDPNELPPFTAMPRNGALAIRFDDLLRDGGNPGDPNYPGTIDAQTVKLFVGAPPALPFDARILPDPNHGDLENGKFHSTRVLVDVAISPLEAQASNLPINPLGLPGATSVAVANAGLRLPTLINASVGQFQVVTNLSGAHVSFTGNGATDPQSPTLDVVRAFRSGGDTAVTGDPQDGFLPDHVPPSLLVVLTCSLTSVHPTTAATDFRVTVRFPDRDCNPRLRVGDLIETSSNIAELVQVGSTGAIAHVIQGAPSSFVAGIGQFTTTWSQTIHLRPECVPHFLPAPDPLTVVHPANKGYTVDPLDVFVSPAGIPMTHWPLNRGIPTSQFTYWTWRDTAKLEVGGPLGFGADTDRLRQITKTGISSFYATSKVPTIGLPLLMEFRTYPDQLANGANSFRIAIALNTSANPYFRAYSTGGVNTQSGQITLVDPDTAVNPLGGINQNGLPTAPRDNVFYYGQADFVVRVSRLHTVWFDTLGTSLFVPPVVEPTASDLPPGTQIQVAFRGAASIAASTANSWHDATNYDAYGDGYNAYQLLNLGKPTNLAFTPFFFPVATDKKWSSNIAALNGARFVQARISFFSNAETNATARLSSLGIAFQH